MLLEQPGLQSFDEAVRPSMTRFGSRLRDPLIPAGLGESSLELAATACEDTLEGPAGLAVQRHEHVPEEWRASLHREGGQGLGHAVGEGGAAGDHLPTPPYTFALPQVACIDTHKFARLLRTHVLATTSGPAKRPADSRGEQLVVAVRAPRTARRSHWVPRPARQRQCWTVRGDSVPRPCRAR